MMDDGVPQKDQKEGMGAFLAKRKATFTNS